jgi:RNA polymerase sigma-70 factor (ECF subfamily)
MSFEHRARDRIVDFDEFCREEYASVVGLAFVLTGSWVTAEDLAQDAFFAAFRQWDRLRDYDKPAAWVRRAVANRAVSWRRRLGTESGALERLRRRRIPTVEIPIDADDLWVIVRSLPRRQAQVIALSYVDDLPLDRVAGILQISEGTAKTHLQRARAALAERVRPTGQDLDSPHHREQP